MLIQKKVYSAGQVWSLWSLDSGRNLTHEKTLGHQDGMGSGRGGRRGRRYHLTISIRVDGGELYLVYYLQMLYRRDSAESNSETTIMNPPS